MKRLTPLLALSALALAQDSVLPPPQVKITEEGNYRFIRSNGLPDHKPGEFPRRGNPNSISAQKYEFRVPLHPELAAAPVPSGHASYGVAINGVPLEPGTAEYWNFEMGSQWNYEALSGKIDLGLDENNAHVQPTGSYHYHGTPIGLCNLLGGDKGEKMLLVGYAADGFPIYTAFDHVDPKNASSPLKKMRSSYQVRKGTRPSGPGGEYDGTFTADYEYVSGSGDLDECNGRFGITPEYPQGTYHYCITAEFPQLARQWKGTPDPSFQKRPPSGGRGGMMGKGKGMRRGGPGGPGGPGGKGRPQELGSQRGPPSLLPPGFPLPPQE